MDIRDIRCPQCGEGTWSALVAVRDKHGFEWQDGKKYVLGCTYCIKPPHRSSEAVIEWLIGLYGEAVLKEKERQEPKGLSWLEERRNPDRGFDPFLF